MSLQSILVVAIVLVAVLYIVFHARKRRADLKKKMAACASCPLAQAEQTRTDSGPRA